MDIKDYLARWALYVYQIGGGEDISAIDNKEMHDFHRVAVEIEKWARENGFNPSREMQHATHKILMYRLRDDLNYELIKSEIDEIKLAIEKGMVLYHDICENRRSLIAPADWITPTEAKRRIDTALSLYSASGEYNFSLTRISKACSAGQIESLGKGKGQRRINPASLEIYIRNLIDSECNESD